MLADGGEPLVLRRGVATEFISLKPCCLSDHFGKPLRGLIQSEEDVLPGGKHFLLIKACFQGFPFNISVENAFARLKNNQKTSRGRNTTTRNLCANHVISEAKKVHVTELESESGAVDPLTNSGAASTLVLQGQPATPRAEEGGSLRSLFVLAACFRPYARVRGL